MKVTCLLGQLYSGSLGTRKGIAQFFEQEHLRDTVLGSLGVTLLRAWAWKCLV